MTDEQILEKWEEFKQLLLSTNRQNINVLIQWLDQSDFKFAPGSTKYHHSYRGGLLQHSLEVYYNMYDFENQLKFFDIQEDSIKIMALLHDICKVNSYKTELRNTKDDKGNWIKVPYYTFDELEPIGHSDKSIMIIYENGVPLTKLERACIRNHMGFTEQEYAPRVSQLFSKCPQSLILYWADLESTYTQGSADLIPKFKEKLLGRNIKESVKLYEDKQSIIINGTKYKLAPQDSIVDNTTIIVLKNDLGVDTKVYSPYKDGLPF